MRRSFLTLTTLILILGVAGPVSADQTKNFRAHLNGGSEVPAVDSGGQGQAIFMVDGDQIHFKLITANVDGITMSHIHCGASGVNGPVVVFLFHPVPSGVDNNGILAQGSFTAADFTPPAARPACANIDTIEELVDLMASGGAYVNVHTLAFPPGEIRGQIN